MEAEELPDLCETYEVEAVPTFVLLKNGKVIDRIQGANAPELTKKIRMHSERELALPESTPGSVGDAPASTDPKQSLEDRLRALVKRDHVLLFMKVNSCVAFVCVECLLVWTLPALFPTLSALFSFMFMFCWCCWL